jgi:hypothetical protein
MANLEVKNKNVTQKYLVHAQHIYAIGKITQAEKH